MSLDNIPKLPNQAEAQNPEYTLEKNFKPFFLQKQPFLHKSNDTQDTLKASYVSFNRQVLPSILKLSSHESNEKTDKITERLNHLAGLTITQTAKSLGYKSHEKIEIAKVDLLTLDATLGMLSKFIQDSANTGKTIDQIEGDLNLFLNESLNTNTREQNITEIIKSQVNLDSPSFLSAKNQLFLSTLAESKIIQLTSSLLEDPKSNKDKILHIAHHLPTSNLTLVSTQILEAINANPKNQDLKNLFKDINSQRSHGEKAIQEQFAKSLSVLSPRLDYGRGLKNFSQNRIFLGLSYVWSTLVFLGNSIQAVALTMGNNRSENKAAILKSLAMAGAAGGIMGVTGTSILTGEPPLKVAENFLNKAFNFLSLSKEDIDAMSVQEAAVTVPRMLDQSGPYISAIFTDEDIIQSVTSTKTLIDGKSKLTDKLALEEINNIHKDLQKRNPEKAKFFETNYLKPAQSNPKQSLLLIYFIQKSYQKAQITNQNSFYKKLKQDPKKYPAISDFKALENA